MEPEIEQAMKRAGLKLGGGLLVLCAVIGLRVVTASPDFVEDEVAKLALTDLEIEPDAAVQDGGLTSADPAGRPHGKTSADVSADALGDDASTVARLGAGVKQMLSNSGSGGQDTERLVSCQLGGRTHYMRAADCAARGGRSTDLSED